MSIQTIFKAGNSKVVSIPSDLFRELDLKIGQKVVVEKNDDESIVIKKQTLGKNTKSKQDFQNWLDTFMTENGEALDELAQR
jgi:putative addiction module antidote